MFQFNENEIIIRISQYFGNAKNFVSCLVRCQFSQASVTIHIFKNILDKIKAYDTYDVSSSVQCDNEISILPSHYFHCYFGEIRSVGNAVLAKSSSKRVCIIASSVLYRQQTLKIEILRHIITQQL